MWSVLPGALCTHGAALLNHTWLQPGRINGQQHGQQSGDHKSDKGFTVACGMLHVMTMSCVDHGIDRALGDDSRAH